MTSWHSVRARFHSSRGSFRSIGDLIWLISGFHWHYNFLELISVASWRHCGRIHTAPPWPEILIFGVRQEPMAYHIRHIPLNSSLKTLQDQWNFECDPLVCEGTNSWGTDWVAPWSVRLLWARSLDVQHTGSMINFENIPTNTVLYSCIAVIENVRTFSSFQQYAFTTDYFNFSTGQAVRDCRS